MYTYGIFVNTVEIKWTELNWTCGSRIEVPGLYQLSYLALHWRSPYFVNIFDYID